jgi:hypothetical protein
MRPVLRNLAHRGDARPAVVTRYLRWRDIGRE